MKPAVAMQARSFVSVAFLILGCSTDVAYSEPPAGSSGKPKDAAMPGMNMPGMNMPGMPSSTPVASFQGDALYVVNGGSNSISVIDASAGSVVRTISLQNVTFPHHINLSPDRSKILVAIPSMDLSGGHNGSAEGMKGALMVLDATTGATIAAASLEAMNHNAIFSPDGKEVWTALMTAPGKLLILDPKTLETQQTIEVGDMPAEITFSKDGTYAFVANGMSDSVSVIDPASHIVVETISVGKDPVGAWPGDDNVMYVDCESGKTISAIDVKTLSVIRTYELGFTPGMARTTPDGSSLWVTDVDGGKVAVFMTSGGVKMGEITAGAGAHGLSFSPDGKTAYVTNQMANTVSVLSVGSKSNIATVKVGTKPNGLVYRSR